MELEAVRVLLRSVPDSRQQERHLTIRRHPAERERRGTVNLMNLRIALKAPALTMYGCTVHAALGGRDCRTQDLQKRSA